MYKTLLEVTSANDELETLQLTRLDVEKWMNEWEISPDEKSTFLKHLVDVHEKSGESYVSALTLLQPAYNLLLDHLRRQAGYEFLGLYLRSLSSTSSAAQEAAVRLIATALRLPTVFDFDPLFKLDAVIAVKDHELFSLLQIYLNDSLLEFNAWEASHPGAFEKYGKLNYRP